eukprot:m.89957 g.89957  ORF g.89957 m.89957 type:complete len:50 (+) comp36630_c0_seq23:2487-2636(+)
MRGLPACEKKMNEIDSVKAVVDSSPFNNSYCNETLQKLYAFSVKSRMLL